MQHKQVLIVDSNELNREMLRDILQDQYTVLEAQNAQQALEVLQKQAEKIALILMDVISARDGYMFLDSVKANPCFSVIPVIVTTLGDSESADEAALAHGAMDFVPVPLRSRVILHRAASIIHLRETAAMVNQLMYDPLTGLYSKEYFYRKAAQHLQEHPEKEYSIVCSNIENFKLYNDAFGAQEGDKLLKEIAYAARHTLEEPGILCRFSADRFIYLQESEKERQGRLMIMDGDYHSISGGRNAVIKWGVYEITDHSIPVEQMCDRASLAVDSIKGQYHKWVAVYSEELRSTLLREQAITDAMETALREGQFCVYLQPKFSLKNDQLAGAEALVYWRHPEMGFLPPGEFVPIFERNGFITRMDRFVWEEICRLMQSWARRGLALLPVSINVSRADLYQPDLVETLTELTRRYGVAPETLHLEITESAYTQNPAQIMATVWELRKRGFVIEMDDFGSGYSSLNMLNQLKIDILKLDMEFIQSEMVKPADRGILRFVVDMAKWMNLSVVAEGVETREQLKRLREMGCDYAQGFLFSKPLTAEEYEKSFLSKAKADIHKSETAIEASSLLLIADEDPSRRTQAARFFGEHYAVVEARNAEEAEQFLAEHARQTSAVLLSITLDDDGAEKLSAFMRRHAYAWQIPILATGPADTGGEERAIEMGAEDYAVRPYTHSILQRRLTRVLGMDAHYRRERELRNEANLDCLTGLLNRRGLRMALCGLRQEDFPLAVYLFDIDGLGSVNESAGTLAGDHLLHSFGHVLRRFTRDSDLLARYGGDEFVVVLRHLGDEEIAFKKGEEICRAFQECLLSDGSRAACSAGIALCGADKRAAEEMLQQASEALCHAKQQNKGNVCLWQSNRL